MAKKRSLPSTPAAETEIRPSKKRKSAEASKAKVKEIVEAEEKMSDDEQPVRLMVAKTTAKATAAISQAEDIDVEELQPYEIAPPPVVAPGFRLWDTSSKLASRGELSQVSQVSVIVLVLLWSFTDV